MAIHIKDKKISIQHYVEGEDDGFGGGSYWENIPNGSDLWTYYRQSSGKEYIAAMAVQAKIDAIFEINWRDDLDTNMRIAFRDKYYDITRIDDFEGYKNTLTISASLME